MFVIAKRDWPECPSHKVHKGTQYDMAEAIAKRGIESGYLEEVGTEKGIQNLLSAFKRKTTEPAASVPPKRGPGRPRKEQPKPNETTPDDSGTDAA